MVQNKAELRAFAAFSSLINWWAKNLLHLLDALTYSFAVDVSVGRVTVEAGNLSPALFNTAQVSPPMKGTTRPRANRNPFIVLSTINITCHHHALTGSVNFGPQKAVVNRTVIANNIYVIIDCLFFFGPMTHRQSPKYADGEGAFCLIVCGRFPLPTVEISARPFF